MPPGSSSMVSAMATARAEQGFLYALGVPRTTVGKNHLIKSQAGLSAVVRPETDELNAEVSSSSESLLARPGLRDGGDRLPILPVPGPRTQETLREVDEVRMLHHQPLETKLPRSGFEKLRNKQAERRERDTRAVRTFEAAVAAISEEMEQRVLEASYILRDGLEATAEAVSAIRAELNLDDRLVQDDMPYVEGIRGQLEVQCCRRSAYIREFREALEIVERLRSQAVGGELRKLVDEMVAIACRMPDEVERVAEEHASELNSILISNRLAHAELLAKMEKEDIAFSVGVRRAWEIRREAWRRLRHDRALGYFRADLTAPNFTNPPDRVALFRRFKDGQESRHTRRVELLRDICSRRPGVCAEQGRLETPAVSAIRESYEALHSAEITAILDTREGLTQILEAKQEEAANRREVLRAELHEYGALSPEPDLEACCTVLESVAHDPQLDEFLRKAGGLKHELLALVQGMRSPDIVYEASLSIAIERTDLVLCGVELERVLDKQGKAGMRRVLADSVERLRKAAKNDVPGVLELLQRQASNLAQIPELDPLLVSGLVRAAEDISRVMDTIGRQGDNLSGGGGATSVRSRTSKRSGVSRGARDPRSGGSTAAGSVGGSRSMRSSGKSSRGGSSRGGGWESELEIDMLQVRAVQRRLGMFACVSDLTGEFKKNLLGVKRALEQQRACNVTVDAAVAHEADCELEARLAEHSQLLERSIHSMDVRESGLHTCAERVCSFFAALAGELEAHECRETAIDEAAETRMFEGTEDFRLADEDREEAVKTSTGRVRMAADEQELESAFARAITLLDELEDSYRDYHKTAFAAAAVHRSEASQEASRVRAAVCGILGLHPPSDDTSAARPDGGNNAESAAEDFTDRDAGVKEWGGRDETIAEGSGEERETQEKNKTEEAESNVEGQVSTENKYQPPRIEGCDGPAYGVEQRPEGIAQRLMAESDAGADEEDADSIDDSVDSEGRNNAISGDENAAKPGNVAGGGASGGKPGTTDSKGRKLAATALAAAAATGGGSTTDLNTSAVEAGAKAYWRKGFVPLEEEKLEELRRDEGEEALQEYLDLRDRRFRELPNEEYATFCADCEAAAAVRAQAREDAAKKVKKGKKPAKGAAPPPPEEEEVEPPSPLDMYDEIKKAVEEHKRVRKEERKRQSEEEKLVPRDPSGELVMHEVWMPIDETSDMLNSLRDDLVARMEKRASARVAVATSTCEDIQEMLTEELEERLRKHWPRKGRTEVGSRQPREGELGAHRQKARRFIRQVRDKLAEQERAFCEELRRVSSARETFTRALEVICKSLSGATSVAALQGIESRCKRLVAGFEAEREAFVPRLHRFVKDEPVRLLMSCDDVTKLCKRFADGGDYDDKELDELEIILQGPRQEISEAAEARHAAIDEALGEHQKAVDGETRFKVEHDRCVMELSLREGLGQRYGAPRRNAQERLRTALMRDQRCADTIHRLLNDLESLLVQGGLNGRVGYGGVINAVGATGILTKDTQVIGASTHGYRAIGDRSGTGEIRMAPKANIPSEYQQGHQHGGVVSAGEGRRRRSSISDTSRTASLTQRLRSNLLSLREAVYRHASFLEFLPAPQRVDRHLPIPAAEVDGAGIGKEERQEKETEPLDPEVTLMPQDGETFAGALDALEVRCRAETRALYESEGKAELLGEDGVPGSLSAWLEESRNRALGEGGHREGAARKLREQVERFEVLIAKRPVPPDLSAGPQAPAAMLLDLWFRMSEAAAIRRRQQEAKIERSLFVWAAARAKHQRLLRPVLGSTDRREELEGLLKLEEGRAAEARSAISTFQEELLKEEEAGAKARAENVAACFTSVAAILDSVVLVDDLGKLPGDDRLAPKRKGLRRLRKAERALQKQVQQQQEEQQQQQQEPPTGGKKSDKNSAATLDADPAPPTVIPSIIGEGRQWGRRRWKAEGLSEFVKTLLAVGGHPTTSELSDGVASDSAAGPSTADETVSSGGTAAAVGGANSKPGASAPPAKEKGKGKGGGGKSKDSTARPAAVTGDEETEKAMAVRRAKEEREAEVKSWVESLRGTLERETYLTTAHRATVATRDAIMLQLVDQAKSVVTQVRDRYGRMLEAEVQWETKWKQLVDLLVNNDAV